MQRYGEQRSVAIIPPTSPLSSPPISPFQAPGMPLRGTIHGMALEGSFSRRYAERMSAASGPKSEETPDGGPKLRELLENREFNAMVTSFDDPALTETFKRVKEGTSSKEDQSELIDL